MKFWSDVQEKLGAGSIFNRVRTPSAEMRFHHMKKKYLFRKSVYLYINVIFTTQEHSCLIWDFTHWGP